MDPATIALKSAPKVIPLLTSAGRRLVSEAEEQRIVTVLAGSLATPGEQLEPAWKVWATIRRIGARRKVKRELRGGGILSGADILTKATDPLEGPPPGESQSIATGKDAAVAGAAGEGWAERRMHWRVALRDALADVIRSAESLDEKGARERAAAVVRRFEIRMAADPVLRNVLQRLDYNDEQATRLSVANSLADIRISMAKVSAAFVAVAAVVGVVLDKWV